MILMQPQTFPQRLAGQHRFGHVESFPGDCIEYRAVHLSSVTGPSRILVHCWPVAFWGRKTPVNRYQRFVRAAAVTAEGLRTTRAWSQTTSSSYATVWSATPTIRLRSAGSLASRR